MRQTVFIIISLVLLTACGDAGRQKTAERLLNEASTHFENGRYDEALATIDSLRHTYPNAIGARKKALTLYQEIELKRAQEELWLTDSLLQVANRQLEELQQQVEADKAALKATPEELTQLTLKRIERDSIRTQFETLGAKIRYIHQKQKEVQATDGTEEHR